MDSVENTQDSPAELDDEVIDIEQTPTPEQEQTWVHSARQVAVLLFCNGFGPRKYSLEAGRHEVYQLIQDLIKVYKNDRLAITDMIQLPQEQRPYRLDDTSWVYVFDQVRAAIVLESDKPQFNSVQGQVEAFLSPELKAKLRKVIPDSELTGGKTTLYCGFVSQFNGTSEVDTEASFNANIDRLVKVIQLAEENYKVVGVKTHAYEAIKGQSRGYGIDLVFDWYGSECKLADVKRLLGLDPNGIDEVLHRANPIPPIASLVNHFVNKNAS